jgi:hypothetical protein
VKSHHSVRTTDLDDGTIAVMRARRVAQVEQRLTAGGGWEDVGLVFTRDDGHWEKPGWAGEQFRRHAAAAGLPRSGPTI